MVKIRRALCEDAKVGILRVVSYSDESFADREAAGRLLAEALNEFRGKDAVVLGIPRGGMVVAGEIARLLDARLDIALSRKLNRVNRDSDHFLDFLYIP